MMGELGFIDQLVDWRAFEHFVRDMFGEDPDLVVEQDVLAVGKSGAKRQTDVKFTHRVGAMEYVTLVECKKWKEKVSRDRIDVLAASIDDLNAAKGVMFTTSGFEEGAELYAKDRGIELFVVRDLTDEEWGLPGRMVSFWWQTFGAEFARINLRSPTLIPVVEQFPTNVSLDIRASRDQVLDPAMTLYSVVDGEPGPNLITVMLDARNRALDLLAKGQHLFPKLEDAEKFMLMPIHLDLKSFATRQLMRKYGALRLERLGFDLVVHIKQTRFNHDRGEKLDLALAVENYVTRQRNVITRAKAQEKLGVFEVKAEESGELVDPKDVVSENTLLCVFLEPWVKIPKIAGHLWPTKKLTFSLPSWQVSVSDVPEEYTQPAGS
jgi:hypothetical protein